MRLTVRKIRIIDFIEIFLLFLVFFPGFISIYTSIYRYALLFQCILAAIMICRVAMHFKYDHDWFSLLVVLFYIIQIVSTAISNTEYFEVALRESLCSLGIVLTFNTIIKKTDGTVLSNFERLFSVYFILAALQMFFAPDIFPTLTTRITQRVYFFGVQNQMAQQMVPMLGLLMFFSFIRMKKNSVWVFVVGVLAFVTELKSGSATGMLAIGLLLLFYCFRNFFGKLGLSLKNVTSGYTAGSLILIFFQSVVQIPAIAYFVQNVLKKDVTLSNRTVIWLRAFENYIKSPLWGIGRHSGKSVMTFKAINEWDVDTSYSAHNAFLQTLVESGILGFVPVVLLIVITHKKSKLLNGECVKFVLLVLVAVLITFLSEAFDLTYFFILIGLLYNGEKVEQLYNNL